MASCGILNINKDPVVARVRLKLLRLSDIKHDLGMKNISPQQQSDYVDRWVSDQLWMIEAKKHQSLNSTLKKKINEYKTLLLVREYQENYIFDKIMISENDVVDYYENNQDRFHSDEKSAYIRVFSTSDKKEADLILSKLKNKEEPLIRGQYKLVYPGTCVDALDNKIFSRNNYDLIGPVSHDGMYYVVSVIYRYAANSLLRVEHVREDIIQKLRMNEYISVLQNKEKELKERINVKIFKNTGR